MEQEAVGVPTTPQPTNAFALFDSLYPMLRRFAAVVADLDMDPDDLVQDALASTLARHPLEELDRPSAYLKQAIVNAASNKRRRAARWRGLLPRVATNAAIDDDYPSDLSILDELSPVDRAVIYLADVEGQPHDLIADDLGLTASAVRKRASRARRQLRESLGTNLTPLEGGHS